MVSNYEKDKPKKGKDGEKKERASLSYNEIMLKKGYVIPYFIWPNVSPLEESSASLSIMQSLPNAKDFRNCIETDDIKIIKIKCTSMEDKLSSIS